MSTYFERNGLKTARAGLSGRSWCGGAAILLIASLLVAACGGSGSGSSSNSATTGAQGGATAAKPATGDPFVIGWTDSQTGATGPGYLATGIAGLQTYVTSLNNRGGVFGRPIKLEVLDDRGDPSAAVTNFRQLADGKSLAVFGSSTSTYAAAQAPLANELKLALVAGGVPDALIYPPQKYFFASNLAHTASAQVQLDYAAGLMKEAGVSKPKVAVFTVDTASAKEFRAYVEKKVGEMSWTQVQSQIYKIGDTDLSAQMSAIARSEPDVVITLVGSNDVRLFVGQLRQRGMNKPIINTYAGSDEPVFTQLKDDKFFAPRSFVWPTDSVAADMATQAKSAGQADQMVSTYFTRGYVLGQLIEATLNACGKDCDRAKFRDALETVKEIDAKGLSGRLSLGPDDHQLVSSAQMFKWDGQKGHSAAVSDWIDAEAKSR
ncbi:MAG: branched-chain amino acid transport system substrate-binding protein [Acidimicrobiia bacterium]|jgi:branched-chain amino acid transport system substrate-binding protein|nr:branched-chain amino acid transport system substrate-binding protein [Acidimicrobiia bacterium]